MNTNPTPDALAEWRQQLCALPVEGPVPEGLDRAIRLRFNTARDDLMSGDSGNIIHRPGHALDLLLAIDAMECRVGPDMGERDALAVAALERWKALPALERDIDRPYIFGFNDGWETALERPADSLEAFHAKPVAGEDASPPPVVSGELVTAIEIAAEEYANEYVMSTEGNDYVPTEWERELISDALAGWLAEQPAPPAAPHPLAQMVALDEAIEAEHPGWMTGKPVVDEGRREAALKAAETIGLEIAENIERHLTNPAMIWGLPELPEDWVTELRSITVAEMASAAERLADAILALTPVEGVGAELVRRDPDGDIGMQFNSALERQLIEAIEAALSEKINTALARSRGPIPQSPDVALAFKLYTALVDAQARAIVAIRRTLAALSTPATAQGNVREALDEDAALLDDANSHYSEAQLDEIARGSR